MIIFEISNIMSYTIASMKIYPQLNHLHMAHKKEQSSRKIKALHKFNTNTSNSNTRPRFKSQALASQKTDPNPETESPQKLIDAYKR